MFSSLQALTKLGPRSDLMCLAGPLIARNHLRALIKLEVDTVFITSVCTALEFKHVKSTVHLVFCRTPSGSSGRDIQACLDEWGPWGESI